MVMADTELSQAPSNASTRVALGAGVAALASVLLLCWSPPASARHALSACVHARVTPSMPAVALPNFGGTLAITGSAVAVASGDVAPSPAVAAVVVPNLNRAVSLSRFGGLYGP